MSEHVDNGCIQTFTGKLVNPLAMRAEDVDIRDIAHALSNLCRFTGHTTRFYSVAEHSLHVWGTVFHEFGGTKRDGLYALLHDASEAYLVDIPRPLKILPQFAWYREAEARLQRTIYQAFGLDPDAEPSIVKQADTAMLGLEARDLMNAQPGTVWQWCLERIPKVPHRSLAMPLFPNVEAMFLSVTERAIGQLADALPDYDPATSIAAVSRELQEATVCQR